MASIRRILLVAVASAAGAPGALLAQTDSLVGCYAGEGLQHRSTAADGEQWLLIDSIPPPSPPFPDDPSSRAAWVLGWGGPGWDDWGSWERAGDSIVVKIFTYPETYYRLRPAGRGLAGQRINSSDVVPPHREGVPDPPSRWTTPVRLMRVPCPRAPVLPGERRRPQPPAPGVEKHMRDRSVGLPAE